VGSSRGRSPFEHEWSEEAMDRLGNIEAFVEAAELGSFTRAAERLKVSPSALSRRIGQLEKEVGLRLLHRTTRAVRLSDEGRAFFERTRGALRELAEAHAIASRSLERPAGLLQVEAPTILGRHVVVPAVAHLARRYPEVDIALTLRDHVSDLVSDGIDVALRLGPMADSGLITRRLGRTRMRVCGAPSYLRRRGTPRSVDALMHHERLGFAANGRGLPWQLRDASGVREIAPTRRIAVNAADALIDLAVAGVGLAWMCDFTIDSQRRSGALVEVLADAACGEHSVHAVSLPTRQTLPKVRVFLDLVAAELAKCGASDRASGRGDVTEPRRRKRPNDP
jgi:DNA-binding transcriptional LysR family regulator